jgi:hypothetical protein
LENNIKFDLKEIGFEDTNKIHLAQDRDQRLILMNTVMNVWLP